MAKETLTVEIKAQADKAIQEMRRYNDTMKKSADRMGKLTKMVKAYWAEALVAFAAMKKGFSNPEAAGYTGTVTVASIGIDTRLLLE